MDRIGLLVQLMGNDKAIRDLKELKSFVDQLNNKNVSLRMDHVDARKKILELKREMEDLYKEKRGLNVKFDADRISEIYSRIREIREELKALGHEKEEISIDLRTNNEGLRIAKSEIQELERQAYSLRDVFGGIGDAFSTIGSGLQSVGNIFNTDLLGYAKQFMTWGITSNVIGNWQDAANRFDIMNTYVPYMKIMGYDAKTANKSLDKINENIQGLPIGLDQAAFQTRRYTMFLGDAAKATDLVIGLNKALIAGGAPSAMRNYATYEVERLLATGELSTARQWMALLNGLGVSTIFLKDALGRAEMSTEDFVKAVSSKDGEISGQEFLQGLMNLADNKKLDEALDIYKTTLESGMSNIKFAITRGKEHIFQALNETFKDTTGMNISDYIYEGRDFINRAFQGVVDYINDNPDMVEGALKRIEGLFDRVEGFNWAGLGSSVIGSFEKLFDIITWVYDHVPPKAIESFLTFSMVWASPLGKAFSFFGNIFSTLARFPIPNFGGLIRGFRGFGRLMPVMTTSLKDIGKGFLGASAFIGIIAEIGLVVAEFTKVAELISKADLTGFDKNIGPLTNFIGQVGALTTGITAIMTGITTTGVGGVAVGIGELLTGGFFALIGEFGLVMNEFVDLANNIARAKLPTDYQLDRISKVIGSFGTTFGTNLVNVNIPAGKIRKLSKALDLVDDIAESLESFKRIGETKIDTGKAGERITEIVDIMRQMSEAMSVPELTSFDMKDNLGIITNFKNAVTQIEESFEIFNNIGEITTKKKGKKGKKKTVDIDYNAIKDKIVGMVNGMEQISRAIDENKGIIETWRDKIVAGMKDDIVGAWNDAMKEIYSLGDNLNKTDKFFAKNKDINFTRIAYNAKVMLNKVNEIMDEIAPEGGVAGASSEAGKWQNVALKLEAYKDIITQLKDIMDELHKGLGSFAFSQQEGFGNTIDNINALIGAPGSVGKEGSGLASINFGTIINDIFDGMNVNPSDLQSKMEALDIAVQTFYNIAMRLNGMKDTLKEVLDNGVQTNFGTLATSIGTTFAELPEDTGWVEKVQALMDSVAKVQEILNTLNSMRVQLEGIGTGQDTLLTNLAGLINKLKSIFSGGEEGDGGIADIASQVSQLRDELTQLGQVNFEALVKQAENAKTAIDNLKKSIDDLKKAAQDCAGQLTALSTAITTAATSASNNAGQFASLISSMGRVASVASSAAGSVGGLSSAINGLHSKAITLTVNRNFNSNTIPSLGAPVRVATGGKIAYLRKGGVSGIFQPKGTDTVPAMLTPGEWVIRRKAVKTFGDRFMQRVNAMDIPGAMNALMSRSHWSSNSNISYVTNNYNNQTVNQTFHGNRDSKSSYRRANRYVSAL